MIRRFYVHNFRCLENFELPISGQSSVLLIGKNGSGKTTVGFALEILQKIARGTNRVGDLVNPKDLTRGRADVPMRFEIEVELESEIYGYAITFDLPTGFKELRVLDERLEFGSKLIYVREELGTLVPEHGPGLRTVQGNLPIARHLVALPIIQQQSKDDPLFIFKRWLAHMLILRPIPSLISGDSSEETLEPNPPVTNFAAWFSGLLAQVPSAYSKIDQYLKQLMPDLNDIKNPLVGRDFKSLIVQFSTDQGSVNLPFEDLSDGEKCFMICAVVLAANSAYGPVLCFWDEPDNYLAISEVQNFVMALRKAFRSGGQFIATSHNSEAIRAFSDENTLVLYRRNHLEPTIIRKLEGLHVTGDLVGALVRGEVEPDDGP
ncbi:MAG: AAA family ATPase [Bryobacteraceae bacterium]